MCHYHLAGSWLSFTVYYEKNSYAKVCKYIIKWYFLRHRRGHGKDTAVELVDIADSDSVDSKEKQEMDTSVGNVCYAKIPSKEGSGKNAAVVELAGVVDRCIVDSREEQDVDMAVENVCYEKIPSKEGSGKNAVVELVGVVDKGCVNSEEEQDVNVSVENVCYEKIKRGSEKDAVVETVMVDKGIVDCKEQDMGTSVDNVCYDKLESK